MRIVIYGTGGAGGYFGAQLALSGEQVTLVARGEHLKALRVNGLRLETPNGDTVIRSVEATDDQAAATGADVVLLGVKAWQVPDAAQALRWAVRDAKHGRWSRPYPQRGRTQLCQVR